MVGRGKVELMANFHFGGTFPMKGHLIASLAPALSLAQTEGTDSGIAEDEGVLIQ